MIDKEKLEKIKKLTDAIYYAAQQLTTDASRLHKAMEEYHQFIIHEYYKEEPVSKVWYDASEEPKSDKDIAVVTREGCMWSRYKLEDLNRGWKQFVNDAEIDKWAYVSDLINL